MRRWLDDCRKPTIWAVWGRRQLSLRRGLWHFGAGLQPFGFVVLLTQPFGLGWDMAAPLALNKAAVKVISDSRPSDFYFHQASIGHIV